jgi:hypothetical protein
MAFQQLLLLAGKLGLVWRSGSLGMTLWWTKLNNFLWKSLTKGT